MSNINIPGFSDYFMEVSRGNIPGHLGVSIVGDNADVDAAEDIWSGGGTHVNPLAATTHNIVSSDANDTAAGTGIRTLAVLGLDTDWAFANEIVTMNGTAAVLTAKSYVRIYKMFGLTFGSGSTNAGNISATTTDAATSVTDYMAIGKGASLSAFYSIPAGKTGYITSVGGSVIKSGASGSAVIEIDVQARANAHLTTSGWITVTEGGGSVAGTSTTNFAPVPFAPVPAKTDIKARVTVVSTTNVDVAARIGMILIDN